MSKECVTHHYACDCREAKFAELEAENALLADRASNSVIAELRAELEFMSTIQEANDVEITALMEDNVKLEQQLAELREENKSLEYQLWSLCDSEGIEWYGDIPTDPDAPIKQESSDGDI